MSVTKSVLRFRAGRAWIGWPAGQVREVVEYVVPTPLPRAPAHLPGLVSVDGRILTVLDVVPLLQLPADPAPPTRFVVVPLDGEDVAVIAFDVTGVVEAEVSGDADALRGNDVLTSAMAGVARVGGELLWCVEPIAVARAARERK